MTQANKKTAINSSRRQFMVASATAGAGLAIGFSLPFSASAQAVPLKTADEVNVWVVIKPDDTVVIRIARSEMGQGTRTGLAQLVAEELDCDWAKVTTQEPTPGETLRIMCAEAVRPHASCFCRRRLTNGKYLLLN
jgi:isoquinoline 1-oxidoreductase beta subunit